MTPELMRRLYPGSASRAGDTNPENDSDCHTVQLIAPFDLAFVKGIPNIGSCVSGWHLPLLARYRQSRNRTRITGTLAIRDTLTQSVPGPAHELSYGVAGFFPGGAGWSCTPDGNSQVCARSVGMPVTHTEYFTLDVQIPASVPPPGTVPMVVLDNCGHIDWPAMGLSGDTNSGNDEACIGWGFCSSGIPRGSGHLRRHRVPPRRDLPA